VPVVGRRSTHTERQNRWAVNAFLRAAGQKDAYSEKDIKKAVEKLEKKYAAKSVSFIFSAARRIVGGFPEGLAYRFSQALVEQIMLKRAAIEAMVKVVHKEDPLWRAYLLLSTLYGLRRSELSIIEPGDIDLDEGTIFVRTTKFGVQKKQLIPESVRGYLEGVEIAPVSLKTMTTIYLIVESLAGIEHRKKAGWHSIRRAVATGLNEAGVGEVDANKFLRWKDTSMFQHYVKSDLAADRRIFKVHPLLPLWEEE
jgi:integrase